MEGDDGAWVRGGDEEEKREEEYQSVETTMFSGLVLP